MKLKTRITLALAATAALPVTAVLAADYDPPIYVDQAPEYTPVEIGSGWYLRGDVAYLPDETYRNVDFGSLTVAYSERGKPIFASVGFGYHFNDYLRADINFGLLPGNEVGAVEDDTPNDIATARVENSARTAMVNGYVDLGTYVGLTPYIGAGIGVMQSKLEASSVFDDLTVANADTAFSDRETQYSLAYSLNAGLAYQISKNVVVDLGYQFMSAPDAEYARLDSASTYSIHKGVDNHQLKVGLRYDLW
jgi:opacity protein-like surface antigen